MHLYDAGHELKKYTWINTGHALIDQIRAALDHEMYPLFVSKGESDRKLQKIKHSDYLSRSYRSFSGIGGAVFVYGHSLSENDSHIFRLFGENKVEQVFVSLYGDPDSESNQEIVERAHRLPTYRSKKRPMEINFFQAESAQVWG